MAERPLVLSAEEAIARFRARWAHPQLDARLVEERIAIRFEDAETVPLVLPTPPAVRLFVRWLGRKKGESVTCWVSRYVHALHEVDEAIDALTARAMELEARAALGEESEAA